MNKPTRRVRAGDNPPPDIKYADLMPEEDGQEEDGTLVDFLLGLAIIVAFIALMFFFLKAMS
jgi:hypothetical protein